MGADRAHPPSAGTGPGAPGNAREHTGAHRSSREHTGTRRLVPAARRGALGSGSQAAPQPPPSGRAGCPRVRAAGVGQRHPDAHEGKSDGHNCSGCTNTAALRTPHVGCPWSRAAGTGSGRLRAHVSKQPAATCSDAREGLVAALEAFSRQPSKVPLLSHYLTYRFSGTGRTLAEKSRLRLNTEQFCLSKGRGGRAALGREESTGASRPSEPRGTPAGKVQPRAPRSAGGGSRSTLFCRQSCSKTSPAP